MRILEVQLFTSFKTTATRAELLRITIKLRELAVDLLGEIFAILRATFQACVGCHRRESKFVLQTLVSTNVC